MKGAAGPSSVENEPLNMEKSTSAGDLKTLRYFFERANKFKEESQPIESDPEPDSLPVAPRHSLFRSAIQILHNKLTFLTPKIYLDAF